MIREKIHFRFAEEKDIDLYYRWANDPLVRKNSYNQNEIAYDEHVNWFRSKLKSSNYFFYLFLNESNVPIGQVRIVIGDETVIGISVDEKFRGKSLAAEMLTMACKDFLTKNRKQKITAYIKKENTASYSIFKKAGFSHEELVMEQNCESYKLYKRG